MHYETIDQIIKLLNALKDPAPRAARPIIDECIEHMQQVKAMPHDTP